MTVSSSIRRKMKKSSFIPFLFSLLLLAPATNFFAQNSPPQTSETIVKPVKEVKKLCTVNFRELKSGWNPALKNTMVIHEPGVDLRKDQYLELKAKANARRAAVGDQFPTPPSSQKTQALKPIRGNRFKGNGPDRIPNDNDIAISDNGTIVSVTNSVVHMYSQNGTDLGSSTLDDFVAGQGAGTATKFDPVVTYDNVADRFVIVYLNGTNSGLSEVIVCFSASNDPTGNWNIYLFDGEILPGNWTDYPQIGLSSEELFITGNIFIDMQGGGSGTNIWQIDKSDGYAGNNLTSREHYVPGEFSFRPVQGALTLYGPNFYFLYNVSFGPSRVIYMREMSNTIANNGALSSRYNLQLDIPYNIPPNVAQPNTIRELITSDNRVRDAYFENGRIDFVMNTEVGGRAAIYHGFGEVAGPFSSFTGREIVHPSRDVAYPSLAYGGLQGPNGENATLIMANHSSSATFPGNGCWFVDGDGTVSDYQDCFNGVSDVGNGNDPWRWGDYSGFAERTNNPGEAWMAGSYGGVGKVSPTYITQLFAPGTVDRDEDIEPEPVSLSVYPNPTTDLIRFDFEVPEYEIYRVSIRDIQGRQLDLVLEDALRPGEAMLTFNTAHLSNGLYFVVVERGEDKIFQDKFMVKR